MPRYALILTTSMLLIASSASAFESDVHFGLTKWLALKAGFSNGEADLVALGNQRADSGIMDSITLGLEYACLGTQTETSKVAQSYHFASVASVPSPPEKRAIVSGSPSALRKVNRIFNMANTGKAETLLMSFGEALHLLQDSWTYQGMPDTPTFENTPVACDANISWGAAKNRGGFNSHKASITNEWPADVKAMAAATYQTLTLYPPVLGKRRNPIAWDLLAEQLDGFINSTTKQEKRIWFEAQGIKNTNFLAPITLPDGKETFHGNWGGRKLAELKLSQSSQYNVPREIKEYFDQFFSAWLGSTMPESALGNATSGEERDLAARLKLWRMRDHGAVADLAHVQTRLSKKQLETVEKLSRGPAAYVYYERLADAFFPLLQQGPDVSPLLPYIIHILPRSAGGNSRAIAIVKLKHVPYDELGVLAEQVNGKWKAVKLISMVNH